MKTAQYPLPLPHHEAMDAEDLLVTDSNREAVAWLDRWPDWPSHCEVIYGPPASGKTHLLSIWQKRSHAMLMSVSELKTCDLSALAPSLTSVAIDDAEQIAGDVVGEENLFHLYNVLRENKGYLLLAASQAPAQWNIALKDLSSRLIASTSVSLSEPGDDLLAQLLVKQFRDRQLVVETDVIEFMLHRLTRSPAAIRDFVAELDQESLAANRRISLTLVRRVFEEREELSIRSK